MQTSTTTMEKSVVIPLKRNSFKKAWVPSQSELLLLAETCQASSQEDSK